MADGYLGLIYPDALGFSDTTQALSNSKTNKIQIFVVDLYKLNTLVIKK